MAGLVILGAGQAALQLAMSLRQAGDRRPITLIGDEAYPPYARPPLSKSFLKGQTAAEDLYLRPLDWFADHAVTLRLGAPARAVDRGERRVQLEGGTLGYDSLVFATGARPRSLADLPADLGNVVLLRGIDDIRRLTGLLPRAQRVAVVGGGFIGLECAAILRETGRAVTLIEASPRLMGRAVSPALSGWFADLHRARGVTLCLSAPLAGAQIDGSAVSALRTASGQSIPADLVVMGVGVLPNDDLARAAGLACDNGITVDGLLRTEDPAIHAIGDCASFPLPDGRRVRLESVQNAVDQAKHLARVLQGETAPYATTPWFWSDQYDAKLQIAGLLPGGSDAAIPPAAAGFSLDHLRAGQLACRESVNDPRAHLQARRSIGHTAGAVA